MKASIRPDKWAVATATLIGALAVTAAFTVGDYGATVDEQHGTMNGRLFFDWYTSGFTDRTINTAGNHYLYGSFVNAVWVATAKISPFGLYETGHILVAATGLVCVFFAWRIGKLLGGSRAGFLAAAILALTPTYYGHSFMNPKDIPFATLFLMSLYYLLRSYDHFPRLPVRLIVALGVVIGLALSIRIGAVMLFGYYGALALLWVIARARQARAIRDAISLRDATSVISSLLKIGLLAWSIMLVWWPYAQLNPLLNPLRAFRRAANFTDFPATVLFEGRFIPASALPWYYLPKSFAITLPEFYFIALAAGVVALFFRRREPSDTTASSETDRQSKLLFLVFAIVFPVAAAILLRSILYDSNRHFLFVIPALAVLSALALSAFFNSGAPRAIRAFVVVALLAVAGTTLVDMVRLHPYQYIFYNRSFGGLHQALGRYETDYWGQSHKEGIEWLMLHYRPDAPAGSIRVANTANPFQTNYYLERAGAEAARFVHAQRDGDPDVILSITRWNAHLKYPGRVLHVVKRLDTPLLYVIERRPPGSPRE